MPATHKRTALDHDLSTITFDLRRLGSMVEQQTERAVYALQQHDAALARKVVAWDEHANAVRYKIERECVVAITLHQPVARDLRRIVAALHMAIELERMADHADGIANIALRMGGPPLIEPLLGIPRMQTIACAMVRRAVEAYVEHDAQLAHQIAGQDDEMDALYLQLLRILLTHMMQDSQAAPQAIYLLWAAHNLERIGDRATNLCERVIFAEEGTLADFKPGRVAPESRRSL